jgi:hypothetical protein
LVFVKDTAGQCPGRPQHDQQIHGIDSACQPLTSQKNPDDADGNQDPDDRKAEWSDLDRLTNRDVTSSQQQRERRPSPREHQQEDRVSDQERHGKGIHLLDLLTL